MGDADRRGRRASWIAAGLFVAVVAALWPQLRAWYAVERYRRLREHRIYRNWHELDRMTAAATVRSRYGAIVAVIDDLVWERGSRPPLSTIDSLRSAGAELRITADGGASIDTLLAALARAARAAGSETVLVSGLPLGGAASPVLRAAFDRVDDEVPEITSYLVEGDASWVALRGARALESADATRSFLLCLRFPELRAPPLAHDRFARGRAELSEEAAVDHYLGALLRYVRAAGCEGLPVVVATSSAGGGIAAVLSGGRALEPAPPSSAIDAAAAAALVVAAAR
jgi:hypothetical protein